MLISGFLTPVMGMHFGLMGFWMLCIPADLRVAGTRIDGPAMTSPRCRSDSDCLAMTRSPF